MNISVGIINEIRRYRYVILNLFLAISGILLILFLLKFSDISMIVIIESFKAVEYYHLIAIFLSVLSYSVLSSLKWKIVLRELTDLKDVVPGYFIYYSTIGIISNKIVPHVGQFGPKVTSMKHLYNVPVAKVTISVFIEQLFDFLVLILLGFSSVLFLSKVLSLGPSIMLIAIIAMVVGLLFIFYHVRAIRVIITGYNFLLKMASRIPLIGNKFQGNNTVAGEVVEISRYTAFKLFYYSYLKYLSEIFRIYIVATSLNIEMSFGTAFLASPIVFFITIAGSIPGGLGIYEAGWFGILMLLGIPSSDIGAFVIINRILGEAALILVVVITYVTYMLNSVSLSNKRKVKYMNNRT